MRDIQALPLLNITSAEEETFKSLAQTSKTLELCQA
jgi:hypothetical protein